MRKKWSLGLMSLTLLASSLMVTPAFCASNMKLEYANTMQQPQSNTISCKIKLTNTSKETISLEDYTIRYYYTKEEKLDQCLWCDNAAMMNGGTYQTLTMDVKGTFCDMEVPTDTADTYLELGFKEGAGELQPNGTIELQLRITNASWTNYNQANDFSFGADVDGYTEWDNVPVYEKGILVKGAEPVAEGIVDATVSKTEFTYDKNAKVESDLATEVILNDNTLDAVKLNGKALAAEDYSLDADGNFAFSEDYLKGLEVGTYKYVLDFNAGKDAVLTLNVVDTTDYDFAMVLPTTTVKEGDEVTVLVGLQNIPKPINNMDFSLKLDTDNFDFLEAKLAGTMDKIDMYDSLATSYHEKTDVLNVVFMDTEQNGKALLSENGAFMAIKVVAKKDFTGAPLKLNKMGAVADQDLNKLKMSVKTK